MVAIKFFFVLDSQAQLGQSGTGESFHVMICSSSYVSSYAFMTNSSVS